MAAPMKQRKLKRRSKPFVKISYDSGSEADVESENEVIDNVADSKHIGDTAVNKSNDTVNTTPSEDVTERLEGNSVIDKQEQDDQTMSGWADAMSKILGRRSKKKLTILSKSREIKKEKEKENEEKLETKQKLERKRNWEQMSRVKPKVTDREYEKSLQRTATRGVVQLFNAVKKQQKTLDTKLKEVGSSERKRTKVLESMTKGDFVDLLKGTAANVISKPDKDLLKMPASLSHNSSAKNKESEPSWSVLREDFMMGAKMKDWDQESDSNDDEDNEVENMSESD
ncbi:RRP15-like protein [Saccoglossus kowalevskii]|uniref:RRP15-like protein n=1 Tax=Saccoglossus kowalevskii TaxID=10224 RepID=A0ABM0GM60_SACKO|nr:PREDICTED: RRP15-like protein-like [Saccoglossus kowalevskii]